MVNKFQGQNYTNGGKKKAEVNKQQAGKLHAVSISSLFPYFYFRHSSFDNWHNIMCAVTPPIYLKDLKHLQVHVFFMSSQISNKAISSFLVTLCPIKAGQYTVYIVLSETVIQHHVILCASASLSTLNHALHKVWGINTCGYLFKDRLGPSKCPLTVFIN